MDWVCPKSKLPLVFFPDGDHGSPPFYLCAGSRLRYRCDAGIPVLLVDEAEEVTPDDVERLMRNC